MEIEAESLESVIEVRNFNLSYRCQALRRFSVHYEELLLFC